ncbi:MAG: DNA methyltransferase [Chloroflexi bacterium]|nr:DNA methyltransferase [Chloroflexota bacterium]
MAGQNFPDNVIYELDNLLVLRGMNSETVDLIATDPPFNTKRNRAGSAGFYVDNWKWGDTGILPDQWKWNEVHPVWLEEIKDENTALYDVIQATRTCHGEDIAAFLCFLSVRLLEMHRVLKPTGSLYLHCDHTANAYIRMCLDAIFGAKNFRNEIIWRIGWISGFKSKKRGWIRNHDTILYYLKTPAAAKLFNKEYIPYPKGYVRRDGKPPTGKGIPMEDTWNCNAADVLDSIMIKSFSTEKTGSPDQKPLALYERIVKASSNPGDLVLDPFAGCATTMIAAHNLKRRWVGIDRRTDARFHVVCRMLGIKKAEADAIRARPGLATWIDMQLAKKDSHYRASPPIRMDEGETAAPVLEQVYPADNRSVFTHAEMHKLLVDQFGLRCWGCNFDASLYGERGARYLELDHINPKSAGGHNHLDNRALLCSPCNRDKGDRTTLIELRRKTMGGARNARKHPIDLKQASNWCRERLMQELRLGRHARTGKLIMIEDKQPKP